MSPENLEGEATGANLAFAFLGCGAITRRHSRLLRTISAARRFHASRDPSRAVAANVELRGDGAFDSYEAALADARVTCAVIASPPSTHRPLALEALAAGKDVVVEKPAFLTSADVDDVLAAAASNNRMALVAENYHYKPLVGALREIVASGDLGVVRFIHVNALKRQVAPGWRDDVALAGGGALFEGGVHWVHLMASLGLTVRRVRASRPDAQSGSPERSMLVTFDYEGGAVGTLAHSWEIPAPFGGVRFSGIFGTEGSAHFESNGLVLWQRGRRARMRMPGLRDFLGFRGMWRDFVRTLETRRQPLMTVEAARRDLALIEQAYRDADVAE
ncbi:MAG: Inositol 2-dehydrogenase/D-chiro-inositol 3-dehydrogenase [Gemmatimonadaceae bacterium]|nr:Inositol 2-dehydrogenase/D-chiro-inositol 3-dehydrogenase [Gemmatimonadaceae bacterium]